MTWIFLAVAVAVAGLVPLAVLAARVVVAARLLSREIERANRRLAPVQGRLRAVISTSGGTEG